MSLTHEHGSQQHHLAPNYMIRGRHWKQQVDGLTHFATKLRWPDMEAYAEKISDNCRAVTEGTPFHTPLVTPASRDSSHRSSYFGGSKGDANSKKRPAGRRTVSAALRPSGWLSKSYVSGLMLPGEGISHFLISTLLENDQDALARLGPMANLYGGFVYGGKSFWSKACVVGRVLVAGKGAAECMGWISSDVTPEGLGDGWADIEVEDIPEDVQAVHKKARLWAKASVERDSDVLGGADPTSVLPADFIIPFENIYKQPPPYLTIELKSLNLYAPVDSVHTTPTGETPFSEVSKPPGIQAYTASITFRVSEEAGDQSPGKDLTFSLSNNVHFVTAHPCVPSSRIKIIKSPSSPTVQQVDISGSGAGGKQASVLGHPLHKFYTYTAIHLSDLLAARDSSLETLLSNYTSTPHCPSLVPNVSKAAKVLVVDCITGFKPPLQEHEIPLSPVVSRSDSRTPQTSTEAGGSQQLPSEPSATESVLATAHAAASQSSILRATEGEASGPTEAATKKMHHETRRRQFGSDMEILVRAFCAEKGWNALISRRRRGCLACAIREAGALGWKVIIRVD
ncbi:hypothetical protein VTK73DRAFT_9942 [Phialemonium thermophilum]|uniref:Uncharacterized protein n=1 Tax=Phialemonium thermophilum TaxID=223376 RepID=A0ABR3XI99_9PEZI